MKQFLSGFQTLLLETNVRACCKDFFLGLKPFFFALGADQPTGHSAVGDKIKTAISNGLEVFLVHPWFNCP